MTKPIHCLTLALLLAMSACGVTRQSVRDSNAYPEKINWPDAYLPGNSSFFVRNQVTIKAPPNAVWEVLVEAETWPDWYVGAENVKVKGSTDGKLRESSVFEWKTMGLQFQSTVREFVPESRLSWESNRKNIQGYHGWLIVPVEGGCELITEESQRGWLTFFEKVFQGRKLHRMHDLWLVQIKAKAENRGRP